MNIFIADDHEFILESLEILLSTIPNFEVKGIFTSGLDLMNALENTPDIDLILTDYNMPKMNGIELTQKICQRFPHIKVLLLTVSEDALTIQDAFKAGVSGYLMKKVGKAELEKAINTIMSGNKYYSESVVFELLNRDKQISEIVADVTKNEFGNLSEREIEIIKLIALEHSSIEIGQKLFISPATVETHRHNIFKKLNIKNAIGLTKFAIKNGFISSQEL